MYQILVIGLDLGQIDHCVMVVINSKLSMHFLHSLCIQYGNKYTAYFSLKLHILVHNRQLRIAMCYSRLHILYIQVLYILYIPLQKKSIYLPYAPNKVAIFFIPTRIFHLTNDTKVPS